MNLLLPEKFWNVDYANILVHNKQNSDIFYRLAFENTPDNFCDKIEVAVN